MRNSARPRDDASKTGFSSAGWLLKIPPGVLKVGGGGRNGGNGVDKRGNGETGTNGAPRLLDRRVRCRRPVQRAVTDRTTRHSNNPLHDREVACFCALSSDRGRLGGRAAPELRQAA